MRPSAEVVDVIFCDQVRVENNGKLLLLGMYLNTIVVAKLPCMIPSFAFIVKWRLREGAVPEGRYSITSPSGKTLVTVELRPERPAVQSPPDEDRIAMGVHQLTPFVFEQVGRHRVSFAATGSRAKTIATFDVVLTTVATPEVVDNS
ncbi:MAG: hypothetical protein MUF10_19125 [Thermoanaerobaculaceae bacterium]|nr:hypothetical protein [Thermoanaerobaculaceae bacterium]